MKKPRESSIMFSVQAKMLAMLVVLSLPLLFISLFQLANSDDLIRQQRDALARSESTSAASALKSFLERNPQLIDTELDEDARMMIYASVGSVLAMNAGTAITIRDARGQVVPRTGELVPTLQAASFQRLSAQNTNRIKWSDGSERATGVSILEPFGWSVAVGLPPVESTPAGRSYLWLTLTWAFAISASILLALWATSRFTNPLRRLAAATANIGEGRLNERVPVETLDEVGTLASALNQMAEDLERRFHQVEGQGAFIREVLDSLPLGVAVLDSEMKVRRANPMFARFTGHTGEQLKGRAFYDAARGFAGLRDVIEDVRRTRQPFMTYGLPLDIESLRDAETGAADDDSNSESGFWDVTISPFAELNDGRSDLILILSEVSKRVRAERLATTAFAAERARAAELESVINQMNDGTVIVDRRGRYRINPAGARILGRDFADFRDGIDALIEDMALRDVSGNRVAVRDTPLRRALNTGATTINERFKIVRPNGNERFVSMSVTPLVGEGGVREGLIAVFHDATDEVRRHNELVEAYQRLREHDRLKSVFFSKISHELRTPLNVILGICQLLARDTRQPLARTQTELVDRMTRNARSLLALVNDLLEYSRLEAGRAALELETFDLPNAINEAVAPFEAEAEAKNLQLEVEVDESIGAVHTDRRKLQQVVASLVGNAVKFTMSGGVYVSAQANENEAWTFEVTDTGIGMTRDEQEIIFDEFRQVDDRLARRFGGIGLGLAITKKIVELMGGKISVQSELQKGSTFRVRWARRAQPRTGTGSLISDSGSLIAEAKISDESIEPVKQTA